jgi:hypothetical protein
MEQIDRKRERFRQQNPARAYRQEVLHVYHGLLASEMKMADLNDPSGRGQSSGIDPRPTL